MKKTGFIAIVGRPNVGKSTLLNALVGEERAIVSDIHGTTRDVIEDTVNLRGITFRFIDTAGIRQTTDVVESIGIERTYQKMQQASIVLWMIDAIQETHPIPPCEGGGTNLLLSQVLPRREDLGGSSKPLLLLFNKADRITPEERETLLQSYADVDAPKLFISAKEHLGLDALESHLVEAAALPDISQSDVIVTNARHYEALTHALDSIHRVQDGLQMQLSGDFVSQDLRECIHHLSDIVGEVSTDSVLQNIFKHFCIGK
jgi:tRNA modification GTPase